MQATSNAEVFRRLIKEGFGRGNLAVLDECFAPDFVEHQFGIPPSVEGLKRAITGLRRAVPDLSHTIDEIVEHEDKVWARMTGRGTNLGPFMGFPPTGRSFAITVIDVCRFEGGRIVEHWGVPDRFALLHQLGLLPAPSATPTAP